MFDANRILGQLLSSPATAGFAGGVAGGMLTSKSGRKMAKKTLKYGGVAAVGALAYTAWQKHQQSKNTVTAPAPPVATAPVTPTVAEPLPAPAGSAFLPRPDDDAANNSLGLVLVRAMIAAANADGRLDGDEMQSILSRIEGLELSGEDKALLFDELRRPQDIAQLAASVTCPEMAAEVYVAALMAIEVDTTGEQLWLRELGRQLQLPDEVVGAIHEQLGK